MKKLLIISVAVAIAATFISILFTTRPAQENSAHNLKALIAKHNIEPVIYKSPQCGCCEVYLRELQKSGVRVRVVHSDDTQRIKDAYKIPYVHRSCHLITYGDYFVEGHVPFEAVEKLLQETPPIGGIALGGMPSGSVGMPGKKLAPFDVVSITDGKVEFFGSY